MKYGMQDWNFEKLFLSDEFLELAHVFSKLEVNSATNGQIIINDDLLGNKQLYYFKNDKGWYQCEDFTIRKDYCYINTNRPIQERFDFKEKDILPENYYCTFDISFSTINNKEYAILNYSNVVYKIPIDYYNNIIEALYCNIYASSSITNNNPLIFVDNNEIIGWLEPCVFEVYGSLDYAEEDNKVVSQDIADNFIFKDFSTETAINKESLNITTATKNNEDYDQKDVIKNIFNGKEL